MINRRSLLLSSTAILFSSAAHATVKDNLGNGLSTSGTVLPSFNGLNINGSGGGSPSISITSIASSGTTSSTVSFNFAYTGSAPGGLTAVWQSGSVSASITGFTASGGSGSATASTPASAGTFTLSITGTGANTSSTTAPNSTVISVPSATGAPWPGQSGNPVGFAAAAGYTGTLTSHAGTGFVSGTSGAHQVYSHLDVNAAGGVTLSSLSFVDFVGVRFQTNNIENECVQLNGCSNVTFSYCSFVPLVSLAANPPGAAWPSASTLNSIAMTDNVNCVPSANACAQYGCNVNSGGPVSWDHCDFWGFGQNGPGFFSTTAQMNCTDCWIHDAANQSPGNNSGGFHTDALGYQNNGTGPNNVLISHCTIASLGNSNGIAWQHASGGYANIIMNGNYLSGFGFHTALGHVSGGVGLTNSSFTNNTFGTDIQWKFGPVYQDYSADFSANGNVWSGNKLHAVAGTLPNALGGANGPSDLPFTTANDGQFIWPNSSLHTTDF